MDDEGHEGGGGGGEGKGGGWIRQTKKHQYTTSSAGNIWGIYKEGGGGSSDQGTDVTPDTAWERKYEVWLLLDSVERLMYVLPSQMKGKRDEGQIPATVRTPSLLPPHPGPYPPPHTLGVCFPAKRSSLEMVTRIRQSNWCLICTHGSGSGSRSR